MRYFTLQAFEPVNPASIGELKQVSAIRLIADTAAEGKQLLSRMIAERSISSNCFYRFEGSGCFPEVRPDFHFNISFYLFEDGRLCPLRIWNRAETGSFHTSDPLWTAHFNGIPPWSLVASIEPRWHLLSTVPRAYSWMGTNQRDWQKRNCWALAPARSPYDQNPHTLQSTPAISNAG